MTEVNIYIINKNKKKNNMFTEIKFNSVELTIFVDFGYDKYFLKQGMIK